MELHHRDAIFSSGLVRVEVDRHDVAHTYQPGDKVVGRVCFEPAKRELVSLVEVIFLGSCCAIVCYSRNTHVDKPTTFGETPLFRRTKVLVESPVLQGRSVWPFEFEFPEFTETLPEWSIWRRKDEEMGFRRDCHPLPPSFHLGSEAMGDGSTIWYGLIATVTVGHPPMRYRHSLELKLFGKPPVAEPVPSLPQPHTLMPMEKRIHKLRAENHTFREKLKHICTRSPELRTPRIYIVPTVYVPRTVVPGKEIPLSFSLRQQTTPAGSTQPEILLEFLHIILKSDTWIRAPCGKTFRYGYMPESSLVVSRVWRKGLRRREDLAASPNWFNIPSNYIGNERAISARRARTVLKRVIRGTTVKSKHEPNGTAYVNPNPLPLDNSKFLLTNRIFLEDNPWSVHSFESYLVGRSHELEVEAWLKCADKRFKLKFDTPLVILPKGRPQVPSQIASGKPKGSPSPSDTTTSTTLKVLPTTLSCPTHGTQSPRSYASFVTGSASSVDLPSTLSPPTYSTVTPNSAASQLSCPTCRHAAAESAARALLLRLPPITEWSVESLVDELKRRERAGDGAAPPPPPPLPLPLGPAGRRKSASVA